MRSTPTHYIIATPSRCRVHRMRQLCTLQYVIITHYNYKSHGNGGDPVKTVGRDQSCTVIVENDKSSRDGTRRTNKEVPIHTTRSEKMAEVCTTRTTATSLL